LKYVPKSVLASPPTDATFRVRYFARFRTNVAASITSGSTSVICSSEDPTKSWLLPTKPTHSKDRIDHPLLPKGTYVNTITGSGPWTLTLSQAATGSDSYASLLDAAGAAAVLDGRTNAATAGAVGGYTLVSATVGNRFSTRVYASGQGSTSGSGIVLTQNAKWSGGQWDRDSAQVPATKLSFVPAGGVRSQVYNGASDIFADSSWTDSLSLPNMTGGASISLSSTGEVTATGSTSCFLAPDGYGTGQTKLGAGCNFRKRFPATPSSFSWTLHSSLNVSWPPTPNAAQPYGLGAWCTVTQTGAVNWYGSVTVT